MTNTYTIKDYYKHLRANGSLATNAIKMARDNYAAGRNLYDIPSRNKIYYNPANNKGGRWVENVSNGLRVKGYADELGVRGIDHKGWYTDSDGIGDKLRGIVYLLPSKGKGERYAYGYADPCNPDCAFLVFDDAFTDDLTGAARAADSEAEKYAEEQREYNDAYAAGDLYRIERDGAKDDKETARQLIREMRGARKRDWQTTPGICAALRSQVRHHLERMSKAREAAGELYDRYNGANPKELRTAFNEGAGEDILA